MCVFFFYFDVFFYHSIFSKSGRSISHVTPFISAELQGDNMNLELTREEKANAGIDLLSAVLPPGADILEAGAPTVSQQTIQSSALLGSPYAQTEWAKNQRLKEKAGAGRGIAPPSAYMR